MTTCFILNATVYNHADMFYLTFILQTSLLCDTMIGCRLS